MTKYFIVDMYEDDVRFCDDNCGHIHKSRNCKFLEKPQWSALYFSCLNKTVNKIFQTNYSILHHTTRWAME